MTEATQASPADSQPDQLCKRDVDRHDDERLSGVRGDWWFTGLAPRHRLCPGVGPDGVITSLPLPDLSSCGRQEVLDYFDNTWTLQEVLFAGPQTAEAFYRRPDHNLRHPLIFYYGHPAVLYVNKLRVAGLLTEPVNAHFEAILETGVDEMSWDDLSRNEMQWPAVAQVHAYRAAVYQLVRGLIAETDFAVELGRPVTMQDRAWALFMGFEHDRIHLETSSVLIREKPLHLLRRHPAWPAAHPDSRTSPLGDLDGVALPPNDLLEVPAADVVIGKPADYPSYGWDNEYGRHREPVAAFLAGRFLVSNGEFYQFVVAGGYREQRFWSEQGWGWRCFRNAKWPRFWVPAGPAGLHRYRLRTLFDEIDLAWDWPVCVNYHEAQAYCAWLSERTGQHCRLITEAEHHRLRGQSSAVPTPADDLVMRHSGAQLRAQGVNLNLAHGSEGPVDACPPSAAGFHDVFGNVWQWCADNAYPLPGFTVHPYYDDFSTPCFDGQHQMILGGSFVSTGGEASIWARFHFRPHFLQHSGFRVAVSPGDPAQQPRRALSTGRSVLDPQVYESQAALNQYLLLHYGSAADTLGTHTRRLGHAHRFPQRVAQVLLRAAADHEVGLGRVLDLGCAVGGASFELSTVAAEVVGVDASVRLLGAATDLARDGEFEYDRVDQGERHTRLRARVQAGARREAVRFVLADACALPPELTGFDAVLMANLLCRLQRPRACLDQLLGPDAVLRPGGLLVIASPWSWTLEHTPRQEWLGATLRTGSSEDALRRILSVEYTQLSVADLPVVLREHERRFQYVNSTVTVWRRRS